jgi:hypothetical protein
MGGIRLNVLHSRSNNKIQLNVEIQENVPPTLFLLRLVFDFVQKPWLLQPKVFGCRAQQCLLEHGAMAM